MDDVDDPTDFKDPRLQKFDHDFRCAICKELYTTPVLLTTCMHSFCSLCIRRRLGQERHCPTCRKAADESKLVRNGALDDLVSNWSSAVRKLVVAQQQQQHNQTPPVSMQNGSRDNNRKSGTPEDVSPGTRRSRRIRQQQQQQPNVQETAMDTPDASPNPRSLPSPAVQGVPIEPATSLTPPEPSITEPEVVDLTQESLVSCPICEQRMKQAVINAHLDRCMRGDSSFIPSVNSSSSRAAPSPGSGFSSFHRQTQRQAEPYGKKPVKLVYDMLKEKDLRRILKDLNLPDSGDKQMLVWRHREYLTLYYANLDAAQPVSGTSLIQRLQSAENAYWNNQSRERPSSSDLEEHNRRYKDEFTRMIEETRKRRRPAATTLSTNNADTPSESLDEESQSSSTGR
ncbi:e3 ubiquitin-protein ligase rad18 [Lichtheimia corymbifera JMRC:FSU:9682]|uniref:Postreplication repair E3 ubiquitin-protein ligase RAD18 n=1 Tax=Lichtheimia corymbifera JMRC:FSU:9682 TaxID=1263082 RepID=A0A068RWC4_9FUNG|nr:e3 ubiquitin-protein ligase rad18 [Lichtheimia corymbifera JMRC:FSU:9682]